MFRVLTLALAISTISTGAMAHPEPDNKTPKSITQIERPQLPSKTEIQEAIKQMPDTNAIMGDMIGLMKDDGFRENMENSARAFGERLERSGALEKDANGLPDFNAALGVMMESFSDEDAMNGIIDTMMGLATAMEKHVPETTKRKTLEDSHKEKAPK